MSFEMFFSRHSPREASGNPENFIDKNQCVSWIPRPDICNQRSGWSGRRTQLKCYAIRQISTGNSVACQLAG